MASSVIFEERVEIPYFHSLAEFRAWALSDDFPERGRIDYIGGRIEVDLSPENLFFHGSGWSTCAGTHVFLHSRLRNRRLRAGIDGRGGFPAFGGLRPAVPSRPPPQRPRSLGLRPPVAVVRTLAPHPVRDFRVMKRKLHGFVDLSNFPYTMSAARAQVGRPLNTTTGTKGDGPHIRQMQAPDSGLA